MEVSLRNLEHSIGTGFIKSSEQTLARLILNEFIKHRRIVQSSTTNSQNSYEQCLIPHLPKVEKAIQNDEPVTLVLPAFPGKSPNPAKVLGPLPDTAEKQALIFLNDLCEKIKLVYSPGAKIILCSDGRVFSDVVGMKEENVTIYNNEIKNIIERLGLTHLSTFNLDELSKKLNFDELRADLMNTYGQTKETLREKVIRGCKGSKDPTDQEAHRMYCGITRFLVEDSTFPHQERSRSSIQKECRKRAYQVILRSNAWSKLIEEIFPDAVRLSIHPQSSGSRKLGIKLLEGDNWITPWHGVAVDTGENFVLMKRSEAEKLEIEMIYDIKGRPTHYRLRQGVTNEL